MNNERRNSQETGKNLFINIEHKLIQHEPIETIADASKILDIPPALLTKVMIFTYGPNSRLGVAALRGADKVDWNKLALTMQSERKKLQLLSPDEIARLTGRQLGSYAPFGYDNRFKVVFDKRLMDNKVVLCSAGTNTESVLIRPRALLTASQGRIGSFSKK